MKSQKSKSAKGKKESGNNQPAAKDLKDKESLKSLKKKPDTEEDRLNPSQEESKHEHHQAKGHESVYYSRVKRERGAGIFGGQGYTSRGGYGRRG